jgi:hypothetical protein
MTILKKFKNITILNPSDALGIIPGRANEALVEDQIIDLWGSDPVQPSATSYKLLAEKVADKATAMLEQASSSALGVKGRTPNVKETQTRPAPPPCALIGASLTGGGGYSCRVPAPTVEYRLRCSPRVGAETPREGLLGQTILTASMQYQNKNYTRFACFYIDAIVIAQLLIKVYSVEKICNTVIMYVLSCKENTPYEKRFSVLSVFPSQNSLNTIMKKNVCEYMKDVNTKSE